MMTVSKYYRAVLAMLQGQTEDLQDTPSERLDWAGPGAVLDLFRKTSGSDRHGLIRAIGQIIQKHPAPPAVIAQLVQIASGLDLAEVEPQVRILQAESFADQEPLKSAITNYLAFRRVNTLPETESSSIGANGMRQIHPIRSDRAAYPEPAPATHSRRPRSVGG